MSRPRLRHRWTDRASRRRSAVYLPRGSLAAILPLPLLMGGCVSDEDELQPVTRLNPVHRLEPLADLARPA